MDGTIIACIGEVRATEGLSPTKRLMPPATMLVLNVTNYPAENLAALAQAMGRRGWTMLSGHVFLREVDRKQSDKRIVQQAEHELKEAGYVAGIPGLEGVCLIGDAEELAGMTRQGLRGTDVDGMGNAISMPGHVTQPPRHPD